MEVKEKESEEGEEIVQIGGIVHEKGKPAAGIANATIVAKEAGMTAKTGDGGRYTFTKLRKGKHSFQVIVPGRAPKETKVVIPGTNYNIEL